jgi:hypothetical protein
VAEEQICEQLIREQFLIVHRLLSVCAMMGA